MGSALIPFRLRTALLESGRSHEYLAEADGLTVAVKCYASGEEPLVMLRVGAASRADSYERVGPDGERIEARSAANNYEPPIPIPGAYFD